MKIGFIGQGFVGKNIADDLKQRGFDIVRYSLDEEHKDNKSQITECDIVFIAVPTPTTPDGFDSSIVEESLELVGEGKIAVIKSTVLPGTTKKLQDKFSDRTILFSPEFLRELTAAYDAQNPLFNIIGIPEQSPKHKDAAEAVMKLLPEKADSSIVSTEAAELFKYIHNIHGYIRVVFANMLYDMAGNLNASWDEIEPLMDADPMMSPWYNSPVHKNGRGAGGNCFVKDMAAFRTFYKQMFPDDEHGNTALTAIEQKNLSLLADSGKSQDIVQDVYGNS